MTEVIDYVRTVDTTGTIRDVKTSTVLQTCEIVKDMDEGMLKQTIVQNEQKQQLVKVGPSEPVDENFMRETNRFVQLTQ